MKKIFLILSLFACGGIFAEEQKLPYKTVSELAEGLLHREVSSKIIKDLAEPVLVELRAELKKLQGCKISEGKAAIVGGIGVCAGLLIGGYVALKSICPPMNNDKLATMILSVVGGTCVGRAVGAVYFAVMKSNRSNYLRYLLSKIDKALVKIRFEKLGQAKEAVAK